MSHTPEMVAFVQELRELLKRHDAVIIGTPDHEMDEVMLEVSAHGSTIIFIDKIDGLSTGRRLKHATY